MTDATAKKREVTPDATAKGLVATPSTSVLIVEDEWMVAWDLERSLKEMGYQVSATVDSSQEALRVAAEKRPDVVLMDIHINGHSDGTAASTISEKFNVPVVYLTAYTDAASLSRAAHSQAYGYVVKPFTSREVKSAIEVARQRHAADARVAERWPTATPPPLSETEVACDPDPTDSTAPLARLFERERPRLLKFAQRICRTRADAEDLVQDACARLLSHLEPHEIDQDRAQYWLRASLTRAFIDKCRKERAHIWLPDIAAEVPEERIERWRLVDDALLAQAVASLSERQRQAWDLRCSGVSYREIATTMGLSPGAVGALLFEARRRIHSLVASCQGQGL